MGRHHTGGTPSGFGALLRQHRRSAGQSQEALAGRAGCSLFTVSRIERGLHEPAWPLALALARALGVGVEAFVAVEDSAKRGPAVIKMPT